MTILITGGEGQVGRELAELLRQAGIPYLAPGRAELDVTSAASLERALDQHQPQERDDGRVAAVIHCAAFTQVDRCETEPEQAFAVNAAASERLARLCSARSVLLVYVSTDFVFDGARGTPYEVHDAAHPLSVYGASKLAGEEAVRRETARHYVLRTSWVFGPYGQNFPRAMLRAAAAGQPLRVVDDQIGAPTYARDLAEGLLALLGIDTPSAGIARIARQHPAAGPAPFGIYHLTNAGSCSWHAFALEVLRQAGWSREIAPIAGAELARPARRPAYSVLSLASLRAQGLSPRPWEEALGDFLSRLRPLEPGLFPAGRFPAGRFPAGRFPC